MITVDVVKYALRQTRDGTIISFVLHPNDDTDDLLTAAIGSQWQIKASPLDEEGNPQEASSPEPEFEPAQMPPARGRRPVAPDKRLAQQAAMMCAEPVFWRFLEEHNLMSSRTADPTRQAATAVRLICGIKTRADIIWGTPAGDTWDKLMGKFEMWKRAA